LEVGIHGIRISGCGVVMVGGVISKGQGLGALEDISESDRVPLDDI